MLRECGTYVLVLYLKKVATVQIGCLGTFGFRPGYFMHVGSAFGGGGVEARTDRHARQIGDSKDARWNIDYLREHAVIQEIWFTHDPVKRECLWAHSLRDLPGLSYPVPGFGSHDCSECVAHLAYSRSMPSIALFRQALHDVSDHAPVFVRFVSEANVRNLRHCTGYRRTYELGRRFLEQRRVDRLVGTEDQIAAFSSGVA